MTNDKTLYIHFGMPKAGSTSIQMGMRLNREELHAAGYYLSEVGAMPGTFNYVNVYRQFSTDNAAVHWHYDPQQPFSALIADFQMQAQAASVVSVEGLFRVPESEVQRLRDDIPASIRPICVIYLRRHDTHIQSGWSQKVKFSRSTQPFDAYIEDILTRQRDSLDYDLILKKWERVFGAENIRVRSLDDVVASGGQLFHDFLATIGVDDSGTYRIPEQKNISPSYKTLELIRTATIRTDIDFTEERLFMKANRFGMPIRDYAAQAGWETERLNLITPEYHARIQAAFAASDSAVARRYFERDTLFPDYPTARPLSAFSLAEDMPPDDMMNLLTAVLAENFHHQDAADTFKDELADVRAQLATATHHNATLAAELHERHNMPLARISELLAAARREIHAAGVAGLLQKMRQWLRGQRHTTENTPR